MKAKRILLFLALPVLILIFAAAQLNAQQGNPGITVSPSNFDLTINPGDHLTHVIDVTNNTNKTITVSPVVKNFTAQGDEGGVDFTQNATTYALSNWISVFPSAATIDPQTTKEFSYTINAPYNAEPGGHFGAIVFTTTGNSPSKTGAAVSQEVASLFLVRVPGNVNEQMTVQNFGTDKSFYEFGPVQFNALVQNNGAVHEHPIGQILIKNMFGQEYTVNFDGRNVLPAAVRIMPATWNKKLLIGKYSATLIATYGTKGQQLYATTEFYAFPVRYGLVALVILVFLFLIRKRLRKAFKAIVTGK
jgi:hypothetical protein